VGVEWRLAVGERRGASRVRAYECSLSRRSASSLSVSLSRAPVCASLRTKVSMRASAIMARPEGPKKKKRLVRKVCAYL